MDNERVRVALLFARMWMTQRTLAEIDRFKTVRALRAHDQDCSCAIDTRSGPWRLHHVIGRYRRQERRRGGRGRERRRIANDGIDRQRLFRGVRVDISLGTITKRALQRNVNGRALLRAGRRGLCCGAERGRSHVSGSPHEQHEGKRDSTAANAVQERGARVRLDRRVAAGAVRGAENEQHERDDEQRRREAAATLQHWARLAAVLHQNVRVECGTSGPPRRGRGGGDGKRRFIAGGGGGGGGGRV
jgi:hypothetical protein